MQHFADGGLVGFGARGLSGLRDLIPKMQAMGYQQAAPAPVAPAPATDPRAAQLQAMIPQMEAMGYKQQRMADGGPVRGPGTGTSDSINAKLSDGEFVVPADTVRKVGARRLQDLVDMTHTPVKGGGKPNHFANGGFAKFDLNAWTQQQDQQRTSNAQAVQAQAQATSDQAQAESDALARKQAAAAPAPVAPATAATTTSPSPAATPSISQSLDQRVGQIPTGGQTAPKADGSQNSFANTETGRNLSNIASALPGSLGGAIPAVAKTGGAISSGIDAATRLLNAGAGAAAISAIPSSAAAQSPTSSGAGAGRGMTNPPAVDPSAPSPMAPAAAAAASAPSSTGPATTSDVTRVGNSYSGTNVAGDITVNGRAPGGGFMNTGDTSAQVTGATGGMANSQSTGARDRLMAAGTGQAPSAQVSQQNMAAADNLAGRQEQSARGRLMALATGSNEAPSVQAPLVRHSGNDWQSRNDLRNAEVSAKSITQSDQWGKGRDRAATQVFQGMLAADIAARNAQPSFDASAMRENAGLRREGMQQAGETQRTGIRAEGVDAANQIARGRLSLDQIAAGYTNRSAERLDRAQAELENAKTPEAQKSARERLMALSGRAPQNEWGVQVTPTTKNLDGSTTQGSVYRFNKATGETSRVDEGQGNAGQAPAKDNMVRGQVYQTRGGPMRWNGSSFERVG
ncbi:MAG: hypothetical protein A2710_26595 [Burkholderiales bacterium RIFCSPHIGHO2_01_FULL_64_960]|nr:MAG: hypothetical protein A2710_26595 [Burkholderiales bacterium RIFCSPHIGHO2_01_FULL_64_960]